MSVLNRCRHAREAGYRHGNRSGCLKGTRETVLSRIEKWAESSDNPSVFWLNGHAGMGKSAIAQTIAERLFANGLLGASFFCSRGSEDRSNLRLIFPTLAFQLAQKYPHFRSRLVHLLQSYPDVIHESLRDQMEKLLVEPLRSTGISTVIVIDALDECGDESWPSHPLGGYSGVKFFITSRLEGNVKPPPDGVDVFTLHDLEPGTVDNDIRCFLNHELSGLAHRRGGIDGWPTNKQLDLLCRRASGFFLYAVATISFLDDRLHHPSDQLDSIMESPENTTYEGKAKLKGYTNLDSLYTSILQAAFPENDPNRVDRYTFSTVVPGVHPVSTALTGSDREKDQYLLVGVAPPDRVFSVRLFHKSFFDFITDTTRCTDPRFYLSPGYHANFVLRCFELMNESLEDLSIFTELLDSESEDLPKNISESGIHVGLEYVCRSWHKYLITTKDRTVAVVSTLRDFLEQNFLFWLERLSVLDAVDDAVDALSASVEWLSEVRLDHQPYCQVPWC
jgi:hypothetical protein